MGLTVPTLSPCLEEAFEGLRAIREAREREAAADAVSDSSGPEAFNLWVESSKPSETYMEWLERMRAKPIPPENIDVKTGAKLPERRTP